MTKEQRVFVLKHWWMSGRTVRKVNTAFRNEFPDQKVPSRQAIHQLAKNLMKQVLLMIAPRSGRPPTIHTEENFELVSETFSLNPRTSQRRASRELSISRSSL
jgi:hypothetical protein